MTKLFIFSSDNKFMRYMLVSNSLNGTIWLVSIKYQTMYNENL